MLDYHVILDLLPTVATFYFDKRLGSDVRLSAVQSSILLALGLQRKTIEEVEVRSLCYLSTCSDFDFDTLTLILTLTMIFALILSYDNSIA